MTVLEISKLPFFSLPLNRSDEDFPLYVRHFLDDYLTLINDAEGEGSEELKQNYYVISQLVDNLKDSVAEFYLGHIPKSFSFFVEALELVKNNLWIPDPNFTISYDDNREELMQDYFFKARISYGKSLSRKEMFIRPFEQREEISTYRYSIPGLPCLYLSNSIYTLWHELGCPDINSLQVSRFELSKGIKKLPFAFDINFFRAASTSLKTSPTNYKELIRYLIYFPLHALCNIKVKNRTSIFKPEYIFPQFLMQWISQEGIGGIEYMSTQIDYSQFERDISLNYFTNLAIPAKSTKASGYCDVLKSNIKVSEPISWQNLLSSFPALKLPKSTTEKSINFHRLLRNMQKIEIIKSQKVNYNDTVFGIMEKYLIENMTAENIQD